MEGLRGRAVSVAAGSGSTGGCRWAAVSAGRSRPAAGHTLSPHTPAGKVAWRKGKPT